MMSNGLVFYRTQCTCKREQPETNRSGGGIDKKRNKKQKVKTQ